MRITRIYQPVVLQIDEIVELSEDAGQHVGVVLRMQPGDSLVLFCGDNHEYEARIESVHRKKVRVLITHKKAVNRESPLSIHLIQSVSKGDRMEWVMQKAVELGVARITPVISARCAMKIDKIQKKWQQWQSIAISACEQSGRTQIPEIAQPGDLEDYIKKENTADTKLILHPQGEQTLKNMGAIGHKIDMLIGPEGGFSDEEMACCIEAGFLPWKLGPRILRTETAALVSLSLLQGMLGDL